MVNANGQYGIMYPSNHLHAMGNENPKIEIRDLRDGDWLWTHKAILFSQYLSAADFKVYCGLSSFAGNQSQQSWPSLITLAEKLNLSRITVIRSLKVLEACQVISVERVMGSSNRYSLLRCNEVRAPHAPTKDMSPHHRLVNFFHQATQKFRGFKPTWSARETAKLKLALNAGIMSETQLEQLMLYFLANYRFTKFSPSMSTFFSNGILNGLMNAMQNDRNFWKDMDKYADRMRDSGISTPQSYSLIPVTKVSELSKALSLKMTVKTDSHVG